MNFDKQVIAWVESDPERMAALRAAATLNLNDWCVAAGFVRNLVWDRLHNKKKPTPLNDVDLIYFDPDNPGATPDQLLEGQLNLISALPWSVKNQARMHRRNGDEAYASTCDAMSFWVEMETAVGVRLSARGEIEILAPFGIEKLFENSITINSKRRKISDFNARIKNKQWLENWPNLRVCA